MAPKPAETERLVAVEKGLGVVQEAVQALVTETLPRIREEVTGLRGGVEQLHGQVGEVRIQIGDLQAAIRRMEMLLEARPWPGEVDRGRDGDRRPEERRDRAGLDEENPVRDDPGRVEVPIGAELRRGAPIREDRGREGEIGRRRVIGLRVEVPIKADLRQGAPIRDDRGREWEMGRRRDLDFPEVREVRREGERRNRLGHGGDGLDRDDPGDGEGTDRGDVRYGAQIRPDLDREGEFGRRRDLGLWEEPDNRREFGVGGLGRRQGGQLGGGMRADGGRGPPEGVPEVGRPAEVEGQRQGPVGLPDFEWEGRELGPYPGQRMFPRGRAFSPDPDPIRARRVREHDPDLAGADFRRGIDGFRRKAYRGEHNYVPEQQYGDRSWETGRVRRPQTPEGLRGRGEVQEKRIEMPIFTGEDPYGWLFRAEHYFDMYEVSERDKLTAASMCMDGRALNWFRWTDSQDPFVGWWELKATILKRFSRAKEGDPMERLMALRQSGSVADYLDRFEMFSASVRGMPSSFYKVVFLNGLREDVRAEVKMYKPTMLQEVMEVAQRIEDRNEAVEKMGRMKVGRAGGLERSYSFSEGPTALHYSPESSFQSNTTQEGGEVRGKSPTLVGSSPKGVEAGGYRRFSEEEVRQRQILLATDDEGGEEGELKEGGSDQFP